MCLTDRNIPQLIKLIHKRPDDRHVNLDIPQLLQRQIVLHHAHNVATDAVNVGVHGQFAVRIRPAAEDVLAIVRALSGEPAEQRTALVRLDGDPEPPPPFCHEIGGVYGFGDAADLEIVVVVVALVKVMMMTMVVGLMALQLMAPVCIRQSCEKRGWEFTAPSVLSSTPAFQQQCPSPED